VVYPDVSGHVSIDESTVTPKKASSDTTAMFATAVTSLHRPIAALFAILNFIAMALLYQLAAAIANTAVPWIFKHKATEFRTVIRINRVLRIALTLTTRTLTTITIIIIIIL